MKTITSYTEQEKITLIEENGYEVMAMKVTTRSGRSVSSSDVKFAYKKGIKYTIDEAYLNVVLSLISDPSSGGGAYVGGDGISIVGNIISATSVGIVTDVTAILPITSTGGATPEIEMSRATTSTWGYLTSDDWNTFNSKTDNVGTVASVTASSPITSSGGAAPNIAIPKADHDTDGYLSSADWNTFALKTDNVGTVTDVTAILPITSTGGATPEIEMPRATTTASGYLWTTDWNTFNSKTDNVGTVTGVTGSLPITSSGGAAPDIAIPKADHDTDGYLSSANWNTFSLASGTVTGVSVAAQNNGVTASFNQSSPAPALTVGLGAITPSSVDTGAGAISGGIITAGVRFAGNLTGNVTGNTSGSSGSCTGNAATASQLYINNDDTGDTNNPILFTATTTAGNKAVYEDSTLYFDNTNNKLYSPYFYGNGQGITNISDAALPSSISSDITGTATNATNIVLGLAVTDTTCYPLIATASSGTLPARADAGLYYNANTNYLYATNFQLASDVSLKTNIKNIDLEPVDIDYKQFVMKKNPDQIRYGAIAQELQIKNPELVQESEDGMLSITYIDLLVKEVAYLKHEVEQLKSKIK